MNTDKHPIQRYGGLAVLLLVALIVFIGGRVGRADDEAIDLGRETAVFLQNTPIPQADEDGTIPIIQDNALSPDPVPHTLEGEVPTHEFQTYIVERGDTPGGIAAAFGIQTETLLGGNVHLSQESSLLQTDMELRILPIDGVLHDVQAGDTLEGISSLYGIAEDEIIAYADNNLQFPYRLYPETQILVPGAVRDVFVWTPPTLASVSSSGSGVQPLVVGTGSFIFPVSSRNFTQFFWYGHPGIDVGLSVGSAVFAADTGTVTYAGWNVYGYGNLIVVNHGNGYETFYAHLSGFNVVPGQIVTKGQVIGATGNTGNSSGPHIHFEIRLNGNRDDPCWYVGC